MPLCTTFQEEQACEAFENSVSNGAQRRNVGILVHGNNGSMLLQPYFIYLRKLQGEAETKSGMNATGFSLYT